MKLKFITLVYIFIIGTYCFADEIFFSSEMSVIPVARITGFNSRTIKIQPEISAAADFALNFDENFKVGLSGGLIYTFSSNIDGGWSYPGFSGFETGLNLRITMPFWDLMDIGARADAGWYRYNLTESYFFIPSIGLYPAFNLYKDERVELFLELPVRYYFHKEADIFMSAGLNFRTVLK